MKLRKAALAFLVVVMALVAAPMFAQDQAPPPPFAPDQLDQLVSRIALYPDPLLAQILAAAIRIRFLTRRVGQISTIT